MVNIESLNFNVLHGQMGTALLHVMTDREVMGSYPGQDGTQVGQPSRSPSGADKLVVAFFLER